MRMNSGLAMYVEYHRKTHGCCWISKFRNNEDLWCICLYCENEYFGEVKISNIDDGNRNFLRKIGIHLKTYNVINHIIPLLPKI